MSFLQIKRTPYCMKKLFLLLVLLGCSSALSAVEGSIDWKGWTLDYSTRNATGLELNNVHYKQRKILARASFPVMRVEYDNDVCGPYADILWDNTYVPIELEPPYASCSGRELCARTYTQAGSEYLELGINSRIGEYEIYQTYIFSPLGFFDSFAFSRGLQCASDHRHHAHWVFDFDIDGKANDQVLKNSGNLQTSEFNDQKTATNYWTIRDAETGLLVELIPGSEDGFPDDFSQWDLAVRKWNEGETGLWRLGPRGEIGDHYNNSESIDRQDIVLWYITHLDHQALDGNTKWHSSGPRIRVVNP